MDLNTYKLMHLVGMALVLMSLGARAFFAMQGGDKLSDKARGLGAGTHGIGLLLLLVGGFGMLAKLGISGIPGWIHPKLLIWLLLGLAIAVPYRKPELARPMWFVVPILTLIAAYLGLNKLG